VTAADHPGRNDHDERRDRWGSGPYSASRGAAERSRPRPWYLRRVTVAGAVVAALVTIAVMSDLPTHATRAQQVSDAKSIVSQAYGYLRTCNAGLAEAFSIEAQVASRQLTSGDMIRVPDLVRDDNLACSYTNDDVFQLASLTFPKSLSDSNQFATALFDWIVPDAFGATKAIGVLVTDPGNSAASAQLRQYDAHLTADRAKAERALAAMDRQLHTTLPALPLVKVPAGSPPLASQ
jgi:hypothetical protein